MLNEVNIKPDPEPAPGLGLPLPSWLAGAGSASKSTSTSPVIHQVPHRDFGMAPHGSGRRASDSHAHGRALSSIAARNSSISSTNAASLAGLSGAAPSRSERWAATVRSQLRHIERDGLRRTFWNRRAFGTNTPGGQGYLSHVWDRVRRLPELLLVEYEDPVDPNSQWYEGGEGEHESSDTSDLLEEDGQPSSTSTQRAARKSSSRKRQSHKNRLVRLLNRTRRALGVSRAALVLLLLLLVLGIYESTKLGTLSTRRSLYQNPLALKINTKDPFKTLAQAGIDIALPGAALAEPSRMATTNPKIPVVAEVPASSQAKVTAIVLNWKRTDNLVVILAHLCSFTNSIFSSVYVWNNNPDTFLTHEVSRNTQMADISP